MLKRLVKQRKHYVSLARRIFSENGRPKIFFKNGRFSAKKGGLESPQFSLRTVLVITFHKYQSIQRSYLYGAAKQKIIGIS